MTEQQGQEKKLSHNVLIRAVDAARRRISRVFGNLRGNNEPYSAQVDSQLVQEVIPDTTIEIEDNNAFELMEQKRNPELDNLAQITRVIHRGKELDPENKREWDKVTNGNRIYWPDGELVTGYYRTENEKEHSYNGLIIFRQGKETILIKGSERYFQSFLEEIEYYSARIIDLEQRFLWVYNLGQAIEKENLLQLSKEDITERMLREYILLSDKQNTVQEHSPFFDSIYVPTTKQQSSNFEKIKFLINSIEQIIDINTFNRLMTTMRANLVYDMDKGDLLNLVHFIREAALQPQDTADDIRQDSSTNSSYPNIDLTYSLPRDGTDMEGELRNLPNKHMPFLNNIPLSGFRVEKIDFGNVSGVAGHHVFDQGWFLQDRVRDGDYLFRMIQEVNRNKQSLGDLAFISISGYAHTYFIKYKGKYFLSGEDGRHRTAIFKLMGAKKVPVLVREAIYVNLVTDK